jgi:hypothetical protein
MGYLNNSSVSVDAILTTIGRQKLAAGSTNGLDIKYFALGDDEVNYDLWNPAHPLGSDYYGIIIENMPVLEASPIPSQNLKSKLITLDKSTSILATITNLQTTYSLSSFYNAASSATSVTIAPLLTSGNNNILGYNLSYDNRYFNVTVQTPVQTSAAGGFNMGTTSFAYGDATSTLSVATGFSFVVSIKPGTSINRSDLPYSAPTVSFQSLLIIEGNEMGGRTTIPVNLTYTFQS